MKTAKEKAEELISKYWGAKVDTPDVIEYIVSKELAKRCALIAVNQIIKSNPIRPLEFMLESEALDSAREYWQEVKQEIEKL